LKRRLKTLTEPTSTPPPEPSKEPEKTKPKTDWKRKFERKFEETDAKLKEIEAKVLAPLPPSSPNSQVVQSPPSFKEPKEEKEEPTPPNHNHKHEEIPHYVGPWQRYCTKCGRTDAEGKWIPQENPDFKDEVMCDPDQGGCGMHLGEYEKAITMKACPNCGGKKAKRIKR
jgi:ribosomal protein L37AE/L43A